MVKAELGFREPQAALLGQKSVSPRGEKGLRHSSGVERCPIKGKPVQNPIKAVGS